jgi:hypothetical protein
MDGAGLALSREPQLLLLILLLELAQSNSELGGAGAKLGPVDCRHFRRWFFGALYRVILHCTLSYAPQGIGAYGCTKRRDSNEMYEQSFHLVELAGLTASEIAASPIVTVSRKTDVLALALNETHGRLPAT